MKRFSRFFSAAVSLVLAGACSIASAQMPILNPDAPKSGSLAPALTGTSLLHPAQGASLDWQTLHGKAVVLEFWATWCVPCIAEIPVLNALQASLDPNKVQFIALDDEDPAVIEAFVKKRPISGWLGFDTSGGVFERYGIEARPTTLVIGPDGRIASTTVHPENLRREDLLALAEGKTVQLSNDIAKGGAAPAALAERDSILKEKFGAPPTGSDSSLVEIILSKSGKDGEAGSHNMILGPGHYELSNLTPAGLLQFGLDIPKLRIDVQPGLAETKYNLHVDAPHADQQTLARAVELAISAGTGIQIEHRKEMTASLVLTAKPAGSAHFSLTGDSGFAVYQAKSRTLISVHANAAEIGGSLEQILKTPIVDETGLKGRITASIKFPADDLAAVNEVLDRELGLTLVPAQRPIERYILSSAASQPVSTTAVPH